MESKLHYFVLLWIVEQHIDMSRCGGYVAGFQFDMNCHTTVFVQRVVQHIHKPRQIETSRVWTLSD